ncbi:hypothetical protein [Deinococcus hopiensis]|nr:hypothetical protein [Deinococcus hopiensis]
MKRIAFWLLRRIEQSEGFALSLVILVALLITLAMLPFLLR